jgi:hypothetical protein
MPLVEKDSTLDMPFVKLWHGLCRKDAFFWLTKLPMDNPVP